VGGAGSAGREKLSVDLLMVRDRDTGRFVYTERLERRNGETPWEYVRRSVRREAQIRDRFTGETLQVIVGWGAESVEEFLESYPEYGPKKGPDGGPGELGQDMVGK
jgi:hypothetical protein